MGGKLRCGGKKLKANPCKHYSCLAEGDHTFERNGVIYYACQDHNDVVEKLLDKIFGKHEVKSAINEKSDNMAGGSCPDLKTWEDV